jgi:hypothetical protein
MLPLQHSLLRLPRHLHPPPLPPPLPPSRLHLPLQLIAVPQQGAFVPPIGHRPNAR